MKATKIILITSLTECRWVHTNKVAGTISLGAISKAWEQSPFASSGSGSMQIVEYGYFNSVVISCGFSASKNVLIMFQILMDIA